MQQDFDAFVLDRISQYPLSLLPCVSLLLLGAYGVDDTLDIVLHGASKSAEELNKLRKLDKRLLAVTSSGMKSGTYISDLLKDETRAGTYVVNPGSYSALFKAIITVICAK